MWPRQEQSSDLACCCCQQFANKCRQCKWSNIIIYFCLFQDIPASPPKTERSMSNLRSTSGFTSSTPSSLASGRECRGSFRFLSSLSSPDTSLKRWSAEAQIFPFIYSNQLLPTKVRMAQGNFTEEEGSMQRWPIFPPKILNSVPILGFTLPIFTSGKSREFLLKGKDQYNWPPCTN